MKNNIINDSRYNEVEFLKMYLTYFENLINPEQSQRWIVDKENEKLYSFCEQCIDRIKLLIDYAIKKGEDINRPSDASLEIATVYQTLLEHFEEEQFDINHSSIVSIDTYARGKRLLLKQITSENAEVLKELCDMMEQAMPEYLEGMSLEKDNASHYNTLLKNVETLKSLKRFRELQFMENALFFTTPEESEREFEQVLSRHMKK